MNYLFQKKYVLYHLNPIYRLESDLPSAFSFDKIKLNIDYPTWDIVNRVAGGFIKVYDLWDMLLYGKKTKLE